MPTEGPPPTDAQRANIIATGNELIGDIEAMLRLPRITEDEWSERFGELPHIDDDETFQPLMDTKCARAILAARDPRLVWSVIEIAGLGLNGDDDDADSYLIVPGYWPRGADGWRLTTIPWDPANQVVGFYKRGGDDDDE